MKISVIFFRKTIVNAIIVIVVCAFAFVGITSSAVAVSASDSPVYKGSSKDSVSVMINVYWGTEYIDEMLRILRENEVKTTFFVGGSWVRDNEETFMKIVSEGHEIGNHGFFHKNHDKLSDKQNKEEMQSTHELVKALCDKEITLFAPPSGAFNQITLDIAKEMGYTTVMWSKDIIDWRDQNEKLILSRATKNLSGGDLILAHPTACTVKVLDEILKKISASGLSVKPVSQVI
ncbi:MAG: polysaccharide deacetylase family protein [Clostridia bacterium]|nr:polysaccharide deacetylase family protein [Clostridia bacterium]